jgi:phosphonate metabolism-associated iron-containing alcohol dehydrogenase
MPTKIVFGQNELKGIAKHIAARKILLVTSHGFESRGVIDTIKSCVDTTTNVLSDIKSHPEFKDLEQAYRKIHEMDFDLIVALGGGSVIDAAKFFSVYNTNRHPEFVTSIIKKEIPPKGYNTIPIIAIPSTAGTGSEITPWATIWDMEEKKKYSLHLPELFSEVAIYDPVLTLTVPKRITIQTGLDAMSHALESIWNKNANPITIGYAIESAKLINQYLPKLALNLENLQFREKVLQASMYAGMAFSNTQTALAHAMSYYITANKGVEHGLACSFTLPMLIDRIAGKYDFVDNALIEIFGTLSSEPLRKTLKDLGVPTDFTDYGLDRDDMEKIKNTLTHNQRASNSLVTLEEEI